MTCTVTYIQLYLKPAYVVVRCHCSDGILSVSVCLDSFKEEVTALL